MDRETAPRRKSLYWLLLIPFIGTLFPSFYASAAPTLWGFPFFYWYQFLWVIISSLITAIVYWTVR